MKITEEDISARSQLLGLWSGVAFFVLFFFALMPLANFIPPPSPGLSGEELLALYGGNILRVKAGIVLGLVSAALLIPWSATIAIQIARMEGRVPFWAITSFGAGIANAVAFYLPFIFWAGAYYTMDRPPELVKLLSDLTWLEFVMVFPPFAIQVLALGIAGLKYRDNAMVFPRWFCFFSIWVALLIVPGGLAIFFRSGPFAWNGLLAFWMPVTVFCVYLPVSFYLLYKSIISHAEERPAEPSVAA